MQESVIYRSIQEEAETRAKVSMQREIALNLLRDGVSVDVVAHGTRLSIEEVQQLQQQMDKFPQN
jgi:predicted transposase YdaD